MEGSQPEPDIAEAHTSTPQDAQQMYTYTMAAMPSPFQQLLAAAHMPGGSHDPRGVGAMHWGGGTPTAPPALSTPDNELWSVVLKPVEVCADGGVKCMAMKFVEGVGFIFPAGAVKYYIAHSLDYRPPPSVTKIEDGSRPSKKRVTGSKRKSGADSPSSSGNAAPEHFEPPNDTKLALLDSLYELYGGRQASVRSHVKVGDLKAKVAHMVSLLEEANASIHDIHVWSTSLQAYCKQEHKQEPFQFNRGLYGSRFTKILLAILMPELVQELGLGVHQTVGRWASILEKNKERVALAIDSLDKQQYGFLKEVISGNTRTLLKVLANARDLEEANELARQELFKDPRQPPRAPQPQ